MAGINRFDNGVAINGVGNRLAEFCVSKPFQLEDIESVRIYKRQLIAGVFCLSAFTSKDPGVYPLDMPPWVVPEA